MAAQQPGQQTDKSRRESQKRNQLHRIRWIIVIIVLILISAGTVIWLLTLQGTWITILPLVIFTILGIIIALFQWLFPVSSNISEHSSTVIHSSLIPQLSTATPSPSTMPEILVHVPPADHTHLPQSGLLDKRAYRGIMGVPPPTDPRTIQQRETVVKDIFTKLTQPDITAFVLTGIGGVGKSTLAALVYRYAEEQRHAGKGLFASEAVWLNIDPAVTFADLAGNLFEVLGKPLPDFTNLSLQHQAMALFNVLNTTDQPQLVILDQFENLLDLHTGHALADRPGVAEWLDALNSQQSCCRILLTSRLWPQGTHEYPPTYMQEYFIQGLEINEGIELLRKQRIDAADADLRTIVQHCQGHAFALTLLASFLRTRNLSLASFFQDPIYPQIWSGNVARNLLDCIYTRQLNDVQRKLLLAFSVYRKPVHVSAAQALLDVDGEEPNMQAQSSLDALLNQHLLQAWGEGRYQLHSIVTGYARSHFVDGNEQANRQALRTAHAKAAQHYMQYASTVCPPRGERRQYSDVEPLVEAVWQLCQAEQWQEAYTLMEQEAIFSSLKHWGGNDILLELYQLLFPFDKWHPEPSQEARIYHNLGVVYIYLGQMKRAMEYLEKALHIYQEQEDALGEAMTLNNLGRVYAELGRRERARGDYEQALHIYQEQGDPVGEGCSLNNLGWVYITMGQDEKAQEYYERALSIFREVGDRKGEAETLNNLGRVYEDLNNRERAQEYYEQAMSIFRGERVRKGEAWSLNNLGKVYRKLGRYDQSLQYLEKALHIRREIDRRGEGRTLKNLGTVHEMLGNKQQAMRYYKEALSIAQEVEDHEGQGKTLRNLGKLYLDQQLYEVALASLLLAQNILNEAQSPYYNESQRGIVTLRKAIGEEEFTLLLAGVEPQAQQIVDQALREEVE
ncbi:MAG TPA: tetratricopeptide repeat protein [Ktedonobacteraceae bacterium]|nr:tetratricopeptide repeat protein [Ktedonobacteraceae bacterium]